MSLEELKRFYKGRAKKPEIFNYDDDGNLVELNKDGSVIKTYSLPNYRPPTYEEFDEMEDKHREAIAIANKEFENARKELRNLDPNTSDSDILRINRKVKEADIKLQAIRFPLQYIELESGIPINKIDFDKSFEKRKFPYNFVFLKERSFTLQEQYVRTGKPAVKPLMSITEVKSITDALSVPNVILFEDPKTNDYGFLSLKWVVEIEFNNTMYNSAKQAIAAELAKSFNDQENLQKIMLVDTPDEVSYELDDVPGDANETKWNDTVKQLLYDVNNVKFSQYPELVSRLLETKKATLGAYIPNDNLIGIGLSIDNIQSKNPINWTGQNLLGKALMDIREKIRSDMAMAAIPTQRVIRRRKPSIAKPVTEPSTEPVTESAIESASQQRSIRRRPKLAPSPAIVAPSPTIVAPSPAIVAPSPAIVAPSPAIVAPSPAIVAPNNIEIMLNK